MMNKNGSMKITSVSKSYNNFSKKNNKDLENNDQNNKSFAEVFDKKYLKHQKQELLEIKELIDVIPKKMSLIYELNLKNTGSSYYFVLGKIDEYYQKFIKIKSAYNNENKLDKLIEINNGLDDILNELQDNYSLIKSNFNI